MTSPALACPMPTCCTPAESHGNCLSCGSHWCDVSPFISRKFFNCLILCEDCWLSLTATERLPFYKHLVESWGLAPAAKAWAIKQATTAVWQEDRDYEFSQTAERRDRRRNMRRRGAKA